MPGGDKPVCASHLQHGRTLHSFIVGSDSTLLRVIGIDVLRRRTAADGLGLLDYEHEIEMADNLEPQRAGCRPAIAAPSSTTDRYPHSPHAQQHAEASCYRETMWS